MKHLLSLTASLGAALVLAATSPRAIAAPPESIPDSLKPPATQSLTLTAHAEGVQIYTCAASAEDSTRFVWTLKAPEATLRAPSGQTVGKHYAGPSWESIDGSKVIGELVAKMDAPLAGAIPWLLLKAKSTTGTGTFTHVVSIQRINTVGGQAPAGGCSEGQSGQEQRVPYQADYRFFNP